MSNRSPRHAGVTFTTPDIATIGANMARFQAAGLAPRTVSSYASDMRVFTAWCRAAGRIAFPASIETVGLYVTDLVGTGRKITTAQRHLIAIHHTHLKAGHPTPCSKEVRNILIGARRLLREEPRQKEPLQIAQLQQIVEAIGYATPIAARNCAVLVFGFATSLRRANLVAMLREDLTFLPDGVRVWVPKEKQDRRGKGRTLAVPTGSGPICPVKLLRTWFEFRGDHAGPVFQQIVQGKPNGKPILGNRLGQIVQECCYRIGLDPRKFGAHSLRAGFCTEALEQGVSEAMICQQTGHASVDTLKLYLRSRDLFRGNAAGRLGL